MNASPYLLGFEKSCYNDDFAPKLLRHSLARRNMGGLGSTRWIGESTKDTVDDTRSLDINRLNHAGCLHPGYRGGWEWKPILPPRTTACRGSFPLAKLSSP